VDDHNEQTQAADLQQDVSPIPDSPAVVGQTDPRVENQSAPEPVVASRDQEVEYVARETEREQVRQNEHSSSGGPSPTSVATRVQSTDPVVDDSQDQA
jgi:hypothetical protein